MAVFTKEVCQKKLNTWLAAEEAIATGHNQYPPGIGVAALREAVSEQQARDYGLQYDPDTQVLITVGAFASRGA